VEVRTKARDQPTRPVRIATRANAHTAKLAITGDRSRPAKVAIPFRVGRIAVVGDESDQVPLLAEGEECRHGVTGVAERDAHRVCVDRVPSHRKVEHSCRCHHQDIVQQGDSLTLRDDGSLDVRDRDQSCRSSAARSTGTSTLILAIVPYLALCQLPMINHYERIAPSNPASHQSLRDRNSITAVATNNILAANQAAPARVEICNGSCATSAQPNALAAPSKWIAPCSTSSIAKAIFIVVARIEGQRELRRCASGASTRTDTERVTLRSLTRSVIVTCTTCRPGGASLRLNVRLSTTANAAGASRL